MRVPSATRLVEAFRDLDRKGANRIRRIAHATDSAEDLAHIISRECPDTLRYAESCYNDVYRPHMWRVANDVYRTHMWRVAIALHAIDRVLGTYGVESLGPAWSTEPPPYEYCNAGDTYSTTLIYTRATDTLRIGCWGDIVERHDRKGAW